MSWIVEQVLRRGNAIRESIVNVYESKHYGYYKDILVYNFENDEYLDLLEIEKAVDQLISTGKIRKIEKNILRDVQRGYTFYDIAKRRKLSRNTVRKIYKKVCERIAFYLGDKYTTEGFYEYFVHKYNLDENQIRKLEGVIS